MAAPLAPVQSLQGAMYIDVNSLITSSPLPGLLADLDSVKWSSFFNLFRCPVGARGRIFNARYGSRLLWLLQEPMDDTTATEIYHELDDAIKTWEPRVKVNLNQSSVTIDYGIPGYRCKLSLTDVITGQVSDVSFNLTRG